MDLTFRNRIGRLGVLPRWAILQAAVLLGAGALQAPAQPPAAEPPGRSEGDDFGGLLEGLLDAEPSADERSDRPAAPGPQRGFGAPARPATPETEGRLPGVGSDLIGSPLQEAVASMRRAAVGLERGDAGDTTRQAQRRAVELLDQLLAMSEPPPSGPSDSPPPPDDGQGDDASEGQPDEAPEAAGELSRGEPREGELAERDPSEGEPSEGDPSEGDPSEGELGSAVTGGGPGQGGAEAAGAQAARAAPPPLQLAEGIWGHLPERTRQELRSALPSDYHPSYRRAIEDYFRRVAEMSADGSP